ncbi:MAG: RNA polymerase sigma factor FliA [Pseudomonadota bacterium]|mgnify:CR=1 FL=1
MSYPQRKSTVADAATQSLITDNLVLVKRIAHHIMAKLPPNIELDDLIQAGMLGLIEAASHYDATRGASFETYAGIRIRGSILDEVRKSDWTPRSVHRRYRHITDAIAKLETETGEHPTEQQVADSLDMPLDEYQAILRDSASCRLFSLSQPYADSDRTPEVASDDHALPDDALEEDQFKERLAEAIARLPERERLVLSLYYQQDMNLKEVGLILEVSESRVCQIHGQALLRLRSRMGDFVDYLERKL